MTPTPTSHPEIETETVDRLRTVLAKASRRLRLTHSDDDLSPSQREVFAAIVRHGPLRLGDLASQEGINTTMLSRIVAKLESRGLITRSLDARDARVVHLSASREGVALHRTMKRERTLALGEAVSHLDANQQRAIVIALPALEELVELLRGDAR
jgi:DNA-binding MarR family transcriptional regulator